MAMLSRPKHTASLILRLDGMLYSLLSTKSARAARGLSHLEGTPLEGSAAGQGWSITIDRREYSYTYAGPAPLAQTVPAALRRLGLLSRRLVAA